MLLNTITLVFALALSTVVGASALGAGNSHDSRAVSSIDRAILHAAAKTRSNIHLSRFKSRQLNKSRRCKVKTKQASTVKPQQTNSGGTVSYMPIIKNKDQEDPPAEKPKAKEEVPPPEEKEEEPPQAKKESPKESPKPKEPPKESPKPAISPIKNVAQPPPPPPEPKKEEPKPEPEPKPAPPPKGPEEAPEPPKPKPAPPPPKSSTTSGADVEAYLRGHNTVRAAHGAVDLTWSDELAAAAQKWANNCQFKHSGGTLGPFGENLAAGSGSFSIEQGIKAWADEAPQYDPGNPQPSHFTQMVWKATTEVGCAQASCNLDNFDPKFWPVNYYVCEYRKQGNVIGQFPQNVQK
jgi:uncharacterized protein YkwD